MVQIFPVTHEDTTEFGALTLKRLGVVNLTPHPRGFLKNVSSKQRVKTWFFVTINIIISHIFSENFIEIFKSFRSYEELLCQY